MEAVWKVPALMEYFREMVERPSGSFALTEMLMGSLLVGTAGWWRRLVRVGPAVVV